MPNRAPAWSMPIQHHSEAELKLPVEANTMLNTRGNPKLNPVYQFKLPLRDSKSFFRQIQQYKLCAIQLFQRTVVSAKVWMAKP